jgi:hypothetical protein
MGYFNAKVGEDNIGMECIMGRQDRGVRNDNGERLVVSECKAVWLLEEQYSSIRIYIP